MVDLDEEVVGICREYLPTWHQGTFDDARTTLFFEDARVSLKREDQTYDVIICDVCDTETSEGQPRKGRADHEGRKTSDRHIVKLRKCRSEARLGERATERLIDKK